MSLAGCPDGSEGLVRQDPFPAVAGGAVGCAQQPARVGCGRSLGPKSRPAMTETTWTQERIALLKDRIGAGLSCGQIARELGVSRNAVIGKANRLGLSRFRSAIPGRLKQTGTRRNARPMTATQ